MSDQDKILIQHLRSEDVVTDSTSPISKQYGGNSHPKLPEQDVLEVGEISLNIAKDYETIAIKNNRGNIVYIPFNLTDRVLNAELKLDDFEEFSMDSFEYLSAYTIDLYDSLEAFKTSTNTNFQTTDNRINQLSQTVKSVSGNLTTQIESLSASTDSFMDWAYDSIDELSGCISSYTEIREAIEEIESVQSETFSKFKDATGVNENIEYRPTQPALNGLNMTQAIDKVSSSADEANTKAEEIRSDVIDNEMVHAAAFARMNHSLGFSVNAEYEPVSETLYGMNVTEAVDYLYDGYEEILLWIGTSGWGKEIRGISYQNLLNYSLANKLYPGQLYRIVDYQAVIDEELKQKFDTRMPPQNIIISNWNSSMAFNVIVMATTNSTINENAIAINAPRWDYYNSADVQAWKIKYCLKNDKNRFSWASNNGRGVIYYMEDNLGNIAPYDFKNIMNIFDSQKFFTFHDTTNNTDQTINKKAHGNIIKPYYDENGIQTLNHISFIGQSTIGNEIASNAHDIRLNGDFIDNKIARNQSDSFIQGPIESQMLGYIAIHRGVS